MLEFDISYHLYCMITLATGRKINLRSLQQVQTYWGLLEGTPSQSTNDSHLNQTIEMVKSKWAHFGEPYLITPPRRDYFHQPGDCDEVRRSGIGRQPEWLPSIECIAIFESINPARDVSVLPMIWYQGTFAFPIDESVLNAIRVVDWNRLAEDCDF